MESRLVQPENPTNTIMRRVPSDMQIFILQEAFDTNALMPKSVSMGCLPIDMTLNRFTHTSFS